MTPRCRLGAFAVVSMVLALGLSLVVLKLPACGTFAGAYGETLNRVATAERSATNVTTAVNFDYRGIDTLGEEFILFASVLGVVVLLRMHAGEREEGGSAREEGEPAMRPVPRTTNAVRLLGLGLVPETVVFGLYMAAHGAITPGGGFQGGVILATAPLLAYLAGGADVFKRIAPEPIVEAGEAMGAAGFVLVGAIGMIAGGAFLQNVLPLGRWGSVASAGTIPLLNVATALEVAGGFVAVLTAFLCETLKREPDSPASKGGS